MKTHTIGSRILRVTGVVTLVLSAALLCVSVAQILQGHHTFFDAPMVVYDQEDTVAIAQVRSIAGMELLLLSLSEVAAFVAGLLGVLFAGNAKKTALCVGCAAGTFALWSAAVVVYNMEAVILRRYDIYPSPAAHVWVIAGVLAAVYVAGALLHGKAARENAGESVAGAARMTS